MSSSADAAFSSSSSSSSYDVLFLDAAGTLIRVVEPVGVTYARIAGRHGIAVEAGAMDHAFRCVWKELPAPLHEPGNAPADDDRSWWRELVRRSFERVLDEGMEEMDGEAFEALFAALYDHFAQARAWELYEDAAPALEALQGRVRMFVLSNFDRRLHAILRGLGIAGYFEGVIVSSEVGAGKPHARMFEAGLRAAQAAPGRCLHAGDEAQADALGAEAAGIAAVHVARPEVGLLHVVEKVLKVPPGTFSRLHGTRK
jgi:putative hydrolase of the HAD superfamily